MKPSIEELERRLQARDKTLRVLSEQLEQHVAGNINAFTLFEQNIMLENAVNKRTHELDEERRSLEQTLEALKQTQAELLQAQKLQAIGQLAGGIAHEINTPAQYIVNNITFITESFGDIQQTLTRMGRVLSENDGPLSCVESRDALMGLLSEIDLDFLREEMPQALVACREGVDRISTIVIAMKDFAQTSHGLMQPLDVTRLLGSTLEITRAKWQSVAKLETDFEPDLPPVDGLKDELGQVFLNLIINAVHAIEDRGREQTGPGVIHVAARRVGDRVEIEVRDNGCGIAPELRTKIFEPFFTTKDVGRGVGQGLAIAYNVVTGKHQGKLLMSSEPGEGTRFIVQLPLRS